MLKYKIYLMTYSEGGVQKCHKSTYLTFGSAYEGFSRYLEKKENTQIQSVVCLGDHKPKGV